MSTHEVVLVLFIFSAVCFGIGAFVGARIDALRLRIVSAGGFFLALAFVWEFYKTLH